MKLTVANFFTEGADVNCRTKDNGRTPLHVAVACDHGDVIDMLLEKGADVEIEDEFGLDAMKIAAKYGNKQCERHLFMFSWQKRAANMKPRYLNPPIWPHQKYDSNLPPLWMSGHVAQTYLLDLNSAPAEYSGSRFDAPKASRRKPEEFASRMKPRKHFPSIRKNRRDSDTPDEKPDVPKGRTKSSMGKRFHRDRRAASSAAVNDEPLFDFDESLFQKPNVPKAGGEDKKFRDAISRINLVLEKNKLAADMPSYEIWRLASTNAPEDTNVPPMQDDWAVGSMLTEFSKLRVTQK